MGQVARKTPCMHYGGINPFTIPATMLGVEVNSMFQLEKWIQKFYLKSLYKMVTEDL